MAENALTRKLGPLPTWGWVAIVGGGAVAYAVWERRNTSTSGSGTAAANAVPPVIEQFQLSTPPEQDDDLDDVDPARHHRRHRPRRPPTDHDEDDERREDHDKDDRRRRSTRMKRRGSRPLPGGRGTGGPGRGTSPVMVRRQARI